MQPVGDMPPEPPCPHVNITGNIEIQALTDSNDDVEGYSTSIRVWCVDCDEPFVWMGLEPGLSPLRPMCDVSGEQLNAPLRPRDAAAGFGEGLPGFHVRNQVGKMTVKDRTELMSRIEAAIVNPSLVTPRQFAEPPERWAARAVLVATELKDQ